MILTKQNRISIMIIYVNVCVKHFVSVIKILWSNTPFSGNFQKRKQHRISLIGTVSHLSKSATPSLSLPSVGNCPKLVVEEVPPRYSAGYIWVAYLRKRCFCERTCAKTAHGQAASKSHIECGHQPIQYDCAHLPYSFNLSDYHPSAADDSNNLYSGAKRVAPGKR